MLDRFILSYFCTYLDTFVIYNQKAHNMILKTIFGIFLLTFFVQGDEEVSQQKWGDFKIKWTRPGTKFLDQPQTKDDAISKNWNRVSDGCKEAEDSDSHEVFKVLRIF